MSVTEVATGRTVLPVAGSTFVLAAGQQDRPERWPDALASLRATGCQLVDLADTWVRIDLLDEPQLDFLGSALADAGITLVGVSIVRASVIDPVDGAANLERILRAVAAAARLRAPLVSIGLHRPLNGAQLDGPFWLVPHPRDPDDDATFALVTERIAEICAAAESYDMQVSLELHESTLLDRSGRVRRILRSVASPRLGVNLDLGNLIRVPGAPAETWQETTAALAPDVNYWHMKNYLRAGHPSLGNVVSHQCLLGDGEIDYRSALRTVAGAGYTGPLVVEHYGGDGLWALHEGRRYLETVIEEENLR